MIAKLIKSGLMLCFQVEIHYISIEKTHDMKIRLITDGNTVRRVEYQLLPTPFGPMLTAWCDAEALCFAAFTTYRGTDEVMRELRRLFPSAQFETTTGRKNIFDRPPAEIALAGTKFRHDVWLALLGIERGQTVTYSRLAELAGHPRAVRAVGTAVGGNPICVTVPCHRVVPAAGGVGNYHGGPEIKKALLEYEKAPIR